MKQKKLLAVGVVFFCVLAAMMGLIWHTSRPAAETGDKRVTVEVIHSDGSEKSFTYQTDLEYLGELLASEGLISGSEGEYGLFVDTVNGEKADYSIDSGWWQLTCNGEDAQTGADGVVLHDGDIYTWTYMIG